MTFDLGNALLGMAVALLAAALRVLYGLALDSRVVRAAVLGEGGSPGIAARVETLTTQSTQHGQQLTAVHTRLDGQDERLDRIQQELDTIKADS